MREELQKKVERAIKLIQSAGKMAEKVNQPLEICYSGGKDSDVILELAKMSGVNYRAIYKNTTIDPPGTIKHVREMGVEVLQPKQSFYKIMQERGFPGRRYRFCCNILKEYKVLDYAVIGVRADESSKRRERYKEPEVCRVYNKDSKARQYLPILEWTTDDVSEFLKERNIKCAPVYYDDEGVFHPERRLGCMGCPLAYKKRRIGEFKKYPNMVKMYCRAGRIYRETHPNVGSSKHFKDEFEWFAMDLFTENMAEFRERLVPTFSTEVLTARNSWKTILK